VNITAKYIRTCVAALKEYEKTRYSFVSRMYRVSQKLLCGKVPRTTLQFFLQQMLEMSPTGLKTIHQWRSEEACPDMSSGPWGTFPASAVGRTATWYVVFYRIVAFGTLCITIALTVGLLPKSVTQCCNLYTHRTPASAHAHHPEAPFTQLSRTFTVSGRTPTLCGEVAYSQLYQDTVL
jgi:hypothetical protein